MKKIIIAIIRVLLSLFFTLHLLLFGQLTQDEEEEEEQQQQQQQAPSSLSSQ
jgi:flagellar basal body-associated protein FliL